VLRGAGAGMIALSLVLALMREGPGFGSLLWATMISLAALAVAFTLAWRPRWLRPLAVALRAEPQPAVHAGRLRSCGKGVGVEGGIDVAAREDDQDRAAGRRDLGG